MFNTDLYQIIPLLFLVATGMFLLILDAFKIRSVLPIIAGIGFVGSCVLTFMYEGGVLSKQELVFHNMFKTGGMASVIHIFLCMSGFFTLFFLGNFMKRLKIQIHESYSLLVFAVIGMIMLANANDLIVTFIGLETMSICLYVMAAIYKRDKRGNESGLKYFLLGAFATGFFTYGIALVYGGSGSTNFDLMDMGALKASGLLYPGLGLMIIGFLFKVSGFPFHAWTPDVYTGSPTPLAGFMATGSKMAAFIAFGSFIMETGIANDPKLSGVIAVCAVLSMAYGNIVAIQQRNLKRMLAYSSIAHSGYVLLGLSTGANGYMFAIFYMFIYTIMNIGGFGLISMVEEKHSDVDMDSWKGLGMKKPWFGALMSTFLFALSGIPPLAGFMGKYFVFAAAVQHAIASAETWFVVLIIIGILTSVIGAFYYIRVIVTLFFHKGEPKTELIPTRSAVPYVGIGLLSLMVIVFGVYPKPIIDLLNTALSMI